MEQKKIIFLVSGCVVIVLAGVIGITLYYTLNDDRDDVSNDSLVNCLPHRSDPSRDECRDKK